MISLKRSLNEFFNVSKKSRQESNLFMEIIGFRFVGVLLLAIFALVIILFYFLQIFIFSALTSWLQWNNGFVDFSLQVLQVLFTLLSNILIFSLIFKYMHNAKVTWRVARNGAIATAILLYLSQWLIGYYLQHYFVMGTLGVANSIFIMLAWVHYSAQIVFFGAKYTYQIGKVYNERIQTAVIETKEVS
jgi:membrane protein